MFSYLRSFSVLLFIFSLQFIVALSSALEPGFTETNKPSELKNGRARQKPIPTPDIYDSKTNDFPEVSYPMSILDMTKPYTYDPVALDPYSPKPELDRSVNPEKITANLRKKLKNLNSATSIVDNISRITATKASVPSDKKKTSSASNTVFSGKFAPVMGTADKPNYYNSRQWARKLAALTKESKPSTYRSKASNNPGTQNATSTCASLWSNDLPVIQVIDNALTMIEKMISNSMLFNSDQHPSISIKEASKILGVMENIQEILKILDCINGVESSLYYNVKTGVSNKSPELNDSKAPSETPKSKKPDNTESSINDIQSDGNTNVTVIQIVDHAITIVEDLLNSTVLQNIEKNVGNQNVVLLSADEAKEMVNVVETIKEILGVLEDLNGNVNTSFMKIKSNSTETQTTSDISSNKNKSVFTST